MPRRPAAVPSSSRPIPAGGAILCLAAALAAGPGPLAAGELRASRDANGRLVMTNLPEGGTAGLGLAERARRRAARALGDASPYAEVVRAAAARHGLSPHLIDAVIAVESGYNAQAVSRKGAMGLMQLMPDTARELGVEDPFDPVANVDGGTRYLRQQLDAFGNDLSLALAAYNAGPNLVRAVGGVPRIKETQEYVRMVRSLVWPRLGAAGPGQLRATLGSNGTIHITNVSGTQSSVRMFRDSRGISVITDR